MNSNWVWTGVVLIIVSIIFTILTLGIGVICTGPMFLIGVILFIIGLIVSEQKTMIVKQEQPSGQRFCPGCGRAIPFDANICPYCGKRF